MKTRSIASTEAQNNFGRVLDDVVQNSTRYVIRRRNASQAVILSIGDLERLLFGDETERHRFGRVIQEIAPTYSIGDSLPEAE
jgi:prevent-host-death family protein